MEIEHQLARIFIDHLGDQIGIAPWSTEEYERLVRSFANIISERCGKPIYPEAGNSLALSVLAPKTAALAFDRVYRIPIFSNLVPEEIGFYCATPTEIGFCSMMLFKLAAEEAGIELPKSESGAHGAAENEERRLRFLCSGFQKEFQIAPTIFYHAKDRMKKAFPTGTQQVLTAAISNIAMVDEKSLDWDQVIEFRKDADTRMKYRRFVRWIDNELKEKRPEEIEDLIAIRLDDYQWALKKHGVKLSLGTLSCLLDPKFLGTVSATVAAAGFAGGGLWAALAGASLTVGQAVVTFGTQLVDTLDERRKDNYEVTYIHQLQKRLG